MSSPQPKISVHRILIYGVIALAFGFIGAVVLSRTIDTNSSSPEKKTLQSSTSLTGILHLNTCGGAQPNYPEPPSCITTVARHTAIQLTSDSNVVSQTTTDDNGRYTFTIQPGDYTLNVRGEADSDGREIQVNPGKNEFNLTATLHAP